jgi:hypothetical protein
MSAKPFEFTTSEFYPGERWFCQAVDYDFWIYHEDGKYNGRIDIEWGERGIVRTKPTSTLKQTLKKLMTAYKPLAKGREEYARIEVTIELHRLDRL